jgi:hypothetical protein
MRIPVKACLAFVTLAALTGPAAAQFGGPPPPPNTGIAVFTHMTGGDGDGQFTGVIDPPKGTFCYLMNVAALANVTAAHVHVGAAGANGGPVIPLETPSEGTSGGCVPIAPDLAQAILANPAGYYVNVHTTAQPAGAIRGQLKK